MLVWWTTRPPTFRQVADRFVGCVIEGNGACVYNLASTQDNKDNPVSPQIVSGLLSKYISSEFSSATYHELETTGEVRNGWMTFAYVVRSSSGESLVGFVVAQTDDGLRVVDAYASLLLGAAVYDAPQLQGPEKLDKWASYFEKHGEELEKMGFRGMRFRPDTDFMTWSQFSESCRSRAQSARAKEARLKR